MIYVKSTYTWLHTKTTNRDFAQFYSPHQINQRFHSPRHKGGPPQKDIAHHVAIAIILDEGEVTRSTRIDLRIHQGSRTWNEKKKAENSSCFLHLRRWEDVKYYLKWSLLQHIRNLWSRIKCCLKLWCFQSLASASHHRVVWEDPKDPWYGGYTDLYLPGRSLSRGSSTCCPHFLALHERLPSLPDAKWCSFSCQKAGVNMEVPRQEIWEILLQFLM